MDGHNYLSNIIYKYISSVFICIHTHGIVLLYTQIYKVPVKTHFVFVMLLQNNTIAHVPRVDYELNRSRENVFTTRYQNILIRKTSYNFDDLVIQFFSNTTLFNI